MFQYEEPGIIISFIRKEVVYAVEGYESLPLS